MAAGAIIDPNDVTIDPSDVEIAGEGKKFKSLHERAMEEGPKPASLSGVGTVMADQALRALKTGGQDILSLPQGIANLVVHPIESVKGMISAPGELVHEATSGQIPEAVGHVGAMALGGKLLPKVGPIAKSVGTGIKVAAPDLAGGTAMIGGGELLSRLPGMEWPARIGLDYPGARLIAQGMKKGYHAMTGGGPGEELPPYLERLKKPMIPKGKGVGGGEAAGKARTKLVGMGGPKYPKIEADVEELPPPAKSSPPEEYPPSPEETRLKNIEYDKMHAEAGHLKAVKQAKYLDAQGLDPDKLPRTAEFWNNVAKETGTAKNSLEAIDRAIKYLKMLRAK